MQQRVSLMLLPAWRIKDIDYDSLVFRLSDMSQLVDVGRLKGDQLRGSAISKALYENFDVLSGVIYLLLRPYCERKVFFPDAQNGHCRRYNGRFQPPATTTATEDRFQCSARREPVFETPRGNRGTAHENS
jgi:hypothetical protein